MCSYVLGQLIAREGLNVLCGPKNCAAQRAVLEGCGMQVIEDNLLRDALNLQISWLTSCRQYQTFSE